jgi:hypothetical protein
MTSKKLLLAGLIAALGLAGTSQAAVINIKPTAVTVFDAAFTDVTSTAVVKNEGGELILAPSATPYTIQVDLSFTVGDLAATELGFGNAAFNVELGGQVAQSSVAPGWNAEAGKTVDKNGAAPGGTVNKWADNGDYGVAGDLRGMVIGTDPPDFGPVGVDPRRAFGKNGDEYFGNVFLEIPGGDGGSAGTFGIAGDGGSTYDAANKLVAAGTTVTGGLLNISVQAVPEPSTLALLGLGSALLVFARKRR